VKSEGEVMGDTVRVMMTVAGGLENGFYERVIVLLVISTQVSVSCASMYMAGLMCA
jgi:hypothetical protein